MLKKVLLSLGMLSILWAFWYGITNAAWDGADAEINAQTANLFTQQDSVNATNIWIATIGTTKDRWWSLIQIIKNAINWVLGMLSLVALVLCLWWWFQIVTAAWDEWKQKKWVSVLKHAAIWLVVIWLSWFVVTIIFRLLRWVTTGTTSTTPADPD